MILLFGIGSVLGPPAASLAMEAAGPAGFFWTDGGYEYPLLWGIAALTFAIRGGGRYSLDALIGREI